MNYSLILREIDAISNTTREYESIQFKIILHNKDNDINITMFESLEFKADYNNKIADDLFLHFNMGLGDFTYDLLPYKNNTEITIIKSFNNTVYENITYKAVLINDSKNPKGIQSNISKEILNKASLIRVSFQLMEKTVEVIRSINVDGIFKKTNVKDVLVTIFNKNLANISINGEKINPMINIVEPDNNKTFEHIVIPTGTLLTDVPTFIQDTKYGIYSGDIGFYIKNIRKDILNYKPCLFLYPLYTIRQDQYSSLFIYHSENKKSKAAVNTYDYKNNILKVTTAEVDVLEKGERDFINEGNSVTYSNMSNIYNYNSTVTNDKISYTNKNQVGSDVYKTEDGLRANTYVGNVDNTFKFHSNLANKNMGLYKFKWNMSNHRYLQPGMNVTVFFQEDNEVKTLSGVLQGYYSLFSQIYKNETTYLMIKLKEVTNE